MSEPSRCKSTQHPDNVYPPFFAEHEVMGGDDEIKEAFYAFSHLKCHEQLWDAEGKEADNFVVKKLLTRYERFFREHPLGGEDVLSLRVPNPLVERADAKILLEALYSIARSYDLAKVFYGAAAKPPIVDVYVPMVRSAKDVLRVQRFYDEHIIAGQDRRLGDGDITIREWLGDFGPQAIRVIPLVEDKESILGSHEIAREIIAATRPEEMRFWYARSDPSLNYGNPATVLMLKIGLQRMRALEKETGVTIYPTLGCGSAPFRGNLRPDNVDAILRGYPSVQTFTVQSSFKYDHPIAQVQAAIRTLNETRRGEPMRVHEARLLPIIDKLERAYREEIAQLAPLINRVAAHVPARRKRKLHVGLFGYAREQSDVKLPRAIGFTCALYSIGLPPELLSLSALTDADIDALRAAWGNFDADLRDAARYANPDALHLLPPLVQERVRKTLERFPVEPDREHRKVTSIIAENLAKENYALVREDIVRAGMIRKFLG